MHVSLHLEQLIVSTYERFKEYCHGKESEDSEDSARKVRFVLWMFWLEEYGEAESLGNTASIGSGCYRRVWCVCEIIVGSGKP
jgi:hypothetical protein